MYVKTIEVPHTVISVTTDENYKYYWVRNLGEHAVGVFKNTPSGPLEGFHVFVNPRECVKVIPEETTLYFASINEDTTNKIEIYGTNTSDCPFKAGKREGDGGGDNTHYKGTTTTPLENGSTTNPIVIDGESYTAVFGDVVVYGYTEFVFDGTAWSEFGRPFDTTPTQGSTNAVTSDGVYRNTAGRKYYNGSLLRGETFNSTNNKASGVSSHAEGYETTASGNYSHAEGYEVVSSGHYSHAEAHYAKASGEDSHAEGDWTTASGKNSHAEGSYTAASGKDSHAGGWHTIANKDASTAIGRWNKSDTDISHLLIVGNGSENARSNILEVSDADMNVNGDIKINNVAIPTPYTTMPTITEGMLGKVVQYVGTSDSNYKQGWNYVAVSDGEETPTYSWKALMDTTPTKGSTNAVTSDGIYAVTPFTRGINEKSAVLAGTGCSATTSGSVAIGSSTMAYGGYQAFACGNGTRASNSNTFAAGYQSQASGFASASFGSATYTNQTAQMAVGIRNNPLADDLFEVGNGTEATGRSNIFEVSRSHANVNGDIQINNIAIPTPYTTMPTITESMLGKIAMYVGATGGGFTQGCFYIAATDGAAEPTYSWVQIGEDSVARAEIADIEAYIGYDDDTIIGLCADFENNTFTRLAGAVGKSAGVDFDEFNMYGGRRLCNLADDGTVNAWYGDDNYTEDGSNGQVMVYQPKFYYKVVPLKLQKNTDYKGAKGYHILKANYYLSDTPKSGFKVHPAFINGNGEEVDGIYIGSYEGSIYDTSESEYLKYDSWDVTDNGDDTYTINNYDGHLADVTATTGDKLSSISGVKPASGDFSDLTRPNAEILAVNRGAGWHSINIQVAMMEMLLFIVEYGTFNTQTAIANGVVSFASGTHNEGVFTGSTASLGNGSGKADSTSRLVTDATEYSTTTTNGTTSIRYRGVENDWGNMWEHIIGANIWGNGSMGGGEVYINSDYTYADNKHDGNYAGVGFTLDNADGFIKYIGYGNEEFDWVMLCSKIGGSSALPVGDCLYKTSNLNEYHTCLLGGDWTGGARAGGFYLRAISGLGLRARTFGSRLLYIPS